MARVVDLGSPRPVPDRPHVEDQVFVPSRAKVERTACSHEFWNHLHHLAKTRLQEIFGSELRSVGHRRFGTDLGHGTASLGCFLPHSRPQLYLATGRDGRPQIRIKLSDGVIHADAGVTDLRLCEDDHATPDVDKVHGVAQWIHDSAGVVLSVGLTRKFRPSEKADYVHYLQVNNIHLKEEPTWALE
jgi:hypothetical protein